jgi:hypothetical protein
MFGSRQERAPSSEGSGSLSSEYAEDAAGLLVRRFQLQRHGGMDAGAEGAPGAPIGPGGTGFVGFVLIWLTILLAGTFRFDFRADLDHIDTLKTLPLSSVAIAAGQLAVPVGLLGTLQVVTLSVLGVAGALEPGAAVAACLGAPLATFLWLATDNFVFLLAPSRAPAGAIDFQAVGRQAVLMLVKLALFLLAGGAAVGVRWKLHEVIHLPRAWPSRRRARCCWRRAGDAHAVVSSRRLIRRWMPA